jgi:hypothetical protein
MHAIAIRMYNLYLQYKILESITIDQHYVQVKEILQQNNAQQKIKHYKME